jgi:outer membrane receptor for ferrienterochelin and colicin
LNTAWYYSGPKRGYDRDNTGNAKTYDSTMVVDESVSYDLDESSMMTFSVKNLFNEAIIYPSYQAKNEGILREGRNWLLTYEKWF